MSGIDVAWYGIPDVSEEDLLRCEITRHRQATLIQARRVVALSRTFLRGGTRAIGESLSALRCLHTSRTSPIPPPTRLWQGLKAHITGRFASNQGLTHVMLASRTYAAIKLVPAGDKNADKSFIPGYWRGKYLSYRFELRIDGL